MSSLRVPAGWTVQSYADGNFGGAVCTFTADTSWVGTACNDKMSSFKITGSGGGGGSGSGVDNVSANRRDPGTSCVVTCSLRDRALHGRGRRAADVNATYNSGSGALGIPPITENHQRSGAAVPVHLQRRHPARHRLGQLDKTITIHKTS